MRGLGRPAVRRAGCIMVATGLFAFGFGLVAPPARAQAQNGAPASAGSGQGAIQDQPLAPPPNTSESKVLGQTAPYAATAPGTIAPFAPEPPPGTDNPTTPAPADWVRKSQVDLILLDKIYGSSKDVTETVGTPFSLRFLTVTVLACWVHPPSESPDAAVFLQVVDQHAPAGSPPEFRGWIFAAEPALSGVTDATTDISVTGCH